MGKGVATYGASYKPACCDREMGFPEFNHLPAAETKKLGCGFVPVFQSSQPHTLPHGFVELDPLGRHGLRRESLAVGFETVRDETLFKGLI